jgi:transposase
MIWLHIYVHTLYNNKLQWLTFYIGFDLFYDNDSKHASKSTKKWMKLHYILDKVMTTPASSPDINPIENVWSALTG